MSKIIAILSITMLFAACSSLTANSRVTVSFAEVDGAGQDVRKLKFLLTDKPTWACTAGDWKKAKAIEDSDHYTKEPAYILEGGKLDVLLITGTCDSYNSYIGSLSGNIFIGEHVSTGLGSRKSIGKVTGTYSRP